MRHISISLILTAACIFCIQSCKTDIGTGTLSTSATYPLSDSTGANLELKIDVEFILSGPGAAARNINSAIIDGYTYRICGPEITRCPVGRESYTYIGADCRIHSAWRHVAYFG